MVNLMAVQVTGSVGGAISAVTSTCAISPGDDQPCLFARRKAAGMLNASGCLGGDVQSPQLFGQLQLSALDIDGNLCRLRCSRFQLTMNFMDAFDVAGIVRTQQGQINLNGNADWSQIDNWRARVTA